MSERQFDIAKNAKVLDDLKADLVTTVGSLFKSIVRGSQEGVVECLSAIIITAYMIGRRLGIKFYEIDQAVQTRLIRVAGSEHEVEKWFHDLTALKEYWDDSK